MKAQRFLALTILFAALLTFLGLDFSVAQRPATLDGQFTVVWGDGQPTIQYYLHTEDGSAKQLLLDEELARSLGGILALNGQQVSVTGNWLAATGTQNTPLFQVESLALAGEEGGDRPDDVVGSQPWVSILCKFADIGDEPQPLSYFQDLNSTTYPGLDHYWREVSYDLVDLVGSDVVGWYVLPQPWSYYVYDQDGDGIPDLDHERALMDCTAVADDDVYFPDFVGINLMFNAVLDCCAWGGSWFLDLDGVSKIYRVTWEPPWGYGNQAVLAHEMGHGFGLPHSSGNYGQTYDNQWDVMSDIWTNCDAHPTFGCLGQHTISYHMDLLGWIAEEQARTVAPHTWAQISLEQLALPQTNDYLIARVPILGSPSRFYTVEVRRHAGYDDVLPGEAVIIHEVDLGRNIPAHVVDIDNNGNTGDAGAQWLPGEQFVDPVADITVNVDAATTSGFVVTIWNQIVFLSDLNLEGPAAGVIDVSYPFTATVEPADATLPITYVWQATGHSPVTRTRGLSDRVPFAWPVTGTQTVTVTALNVGAAILSASHPITIYEPAHADFDGGPVSGVAPLTVTLTNRSSGGYDTCLWTFGDGASSANCLEASHTYTATGAFTVALTIGGIGSTDTLTHSRYITVYQPVIAVFDATPLSGTVPLAVHFANLSTGDYITCTWLFGDGGTSSVCGDPTHTFTATGSYSISLTVGGPGGVHTAYKHNWIEVLDPYRLYLPIVLREQ
jgi:PKD repeat protein